LTVAKRQENRNKRIVPQCRFVNTLEPALPVASNKRFAALLDIQVGAKGRSVFQTDRAQPILDPDIWTIE